MTEVNKKKMYVEVPIKVQAYDTDYMQIVNNTVYARWFEDMRFAILEKYFPLKEMAKEGKSPIVSEMTIKFIKPLTIQNSPVGKAWISELGKCKWVVNSEIWDGDTLYCSSQQTGCYIDLTTKRPTRFNQEFLDCYNSL